MKKKYEPPISEFVLINGQLQLLKDAFYGNSGIEEQLGKKGQFDHEEDEGTNDNWSLWDD